MRRFRPRRSPIVPGWLVASAATLVVLRAPIVGAHGIVAPEPVTVATCVEVFVETSEVRVEVETAVPDLVVFADAFPDDFRVRMGLAPEPAEERRERFFGDRLTIRADGGPPLRGEVVSFETRRREPIPGVSSADDRPGFVSGEPVVFMVLRYPFESQPKTLDFRFPAGGTSAAGATIGFAASHLGLPASDFRPVDHRATLDLDWTDPWNSRFRDRRLWRRSQSPLEVFLSIEPFEVRVEVIARPVDLQASGDLGVDPASTITVENQEDVKRRSAVFLGDHFDLTVDGEAARPVLDRVDFLDRTLRSASAVNPPRELQAVSATLGAVYVLPVPDYPADATLRWRLFPDRVGVVSAAVVDAVESRRSVLRPGADVLRWAARDGGGEPPVMVEVPAVPTPAGRVAMWASWLGLVVAGVALLRAVARAAGGTASWAPTCALILAAGVLVAAVRTTTDAVVVDDERVSEIVSALLHNAYRACDLRDQAAAHERLGRSVAGDELAASWIKRQCGSALAGPGRDRTFFREVELLGLEVVDTTESIALRCAWAVAGEADHLGHRHRRVNRQAADLVVAPIDGVWKIVDLDPVRSRNR